jgi:hypothetical protein
MSRIRFSWVSKVEPSLDLGDYWALATLARGPVALPVHEFPFTWVKAPCPIAFNWLEPNAAFAYVKDLADTYPVVNQWLNGLGYVTHDVSLLAWNLALDHLLANYVMEKGPFDSSYYVWVGVHLAMPQLSPQGELVDSFLKVSVLACEREPDGGPLPPWFVQTQQRWLTQVYPTFWERLLNE